MHALLNWVLMFQISIPLFSWLGTMTKILYEREIAISERRVKPAAIIHNDSLILGKQIINILPEGHATLNPNNQAFCIDSVHSAVLLPIQTNQTTPKIIDIIRVDPASGAQDVLSIPHKDIKKLRKATEKAMRAESNTPVTIHLPVKRTGIYLLQRVLDESDLEVRLDSSRAVVALCPKASIPRVSSHRCTGELSNFRFHVDGTPPMKLRYSKTVTNEDRGHAILHIHPDKPTTSMDSDSVAVGSKNHDLDETLPEHHSIPVPINESMSAAGRWEYMIHDVHDAYGNGVNYTEDRPQDSIWAKASVRNLYHSFVVHERPKLAWQGCDANKPVRVERGKLGGLPFEFKPAEITALEEGPFTVQYRFSPLDNEGSNQEQMDDTGLRQTTITGDQKSLRVRAPGRYTWVSISSKYCDGEILEPSSCSLVNPPEPNLDIAAEPIPDQCAGNSIGLIVNMDTTGTPPFTVFYTIKKRHGRSQSASEAIDRMHTRIEFKPPDTGHYTYEFTHISDSVYRDPKSLSHKPLVVEQDVKAPPFAHFVDDSRTAQRNEACLDGSLSTFIELNGEPPFTLEYELVHRHQRTSITKLNIQNRSYLLETEALQSGGEHVLVLTAVTDQSGCRTALQAEKKIYVSSQKPRAAFGTFNSARRVSILEGQNFGMPLRFQGKAPWTLYYRRLEDHSDDVASKVFQTSNSELMVREKGTYELIETHDQNCPGMVDPESKLFNVGWIDRPGVVVIESSSIERQAGAYLKADVCQDDEDSVEILFSGSAPFGYEYQRRLKGAHFAPSTAHQRLTSGLRQTSIEMETSRPGLYEYKLTEISDSLYDFDRRKFSPIHIRQSVHPTPSASFVDGGKTYRFCQEQNSDNENIMVQLSGRPPFRLDLEIRIQGIAQPEVVPLTHIENLLHSVRLPQRFQKLGSHSIGIRKVQDANGCVKHPDREVPEVQVSIAELPSITAVENRQDFCVGDHISFTLSGAPPFTVFYTFENRERRATVSDTSFRRIAEKPGEFLITSLSDQRSTEACKARTELHKTIHEMPSVRVSKGRISTVDIHQGGRTNILFEFGGTPPFFFT